MEVHPHLPWDTKNRLPAFGSVLKQPGPARTSAEPEPAPEHALDENGHVLLKKTPRPRGRAPKDPWAQIVRWDVQRLEDLEVTLQEYLKNPTSPPSHTTLEFAFPVSAAFMVRDPTALQVAPHYGALQRTAISVIDALAPTINPKDQLVKQRQVAKCCVEAIQRADGFRYTFHNNWFSREDEASRFSFYCNDSPLNKGRAANESAKSAGKHVRKPAYECQGVLAVKFSNTKSAMEVHYKHIPVHPTYDERAPAPRKGSKRYKLMEIFKPESLPKKKPRVPKAKLERSVDSVPNKRTRGEGSKPALQHDEEIDPTLEDDQPTAQVPGDDEAGDQQSAGSTPAGAPIFPAENLGKSQKRKQQPDEEKGPTKKRKTQNQEIQSMPGVLHGFMDSGSLVFRSDGSVPGVNSTQRKKAEPKPLSELDQLKLKLQEAEDRIKRLETKKNKAPPPAYGKYPPYPPFPPYCPYGYPYPPIPLGQAYPPPAAPLDQAPGPPPQPPSIAPAKPPIRFQAVATSSGPVKDLQIRKWNRNLRASNEIIATSIATTTTIANQTPQVLRVREWDPRTLNGSIQQKQRNASVASAPALIREPQHEWRQDDAHA